MRGKTRTHSTLRVSVCVSVRDRERYRGREQLQSYTHHFIRHKIDETGKDQKVTVGTSSKPHVKFSTTVLEDAATFSLCP